MLEQLADVVQLFAYRGVPIASMLGQVHGVLFDLGVSSLQLDEADRDDFLKDVQADRVQSDGVSLALWFNEVIYRLFVEACFADPMYGGNRNAVFWKMIGYPGLPATHALDMVRYRGKPYPGATTPKSIADFT